MAMRVTFWGVRGSLPSPTSPQAFAERARDLFQAFFDAGHRERRDIDPFLAAQPPHRVGGYGGNTLCLEVRTRSQRLVIDAGSGLRLLGYDLLQGPCGKGEGEVHLLFTHFHWDHLIGLPFFAPIFIPGNVLHLYAVQPGLPDVLRMLFHKPNFPVPLSRLGARIEYHRLPPRKPTRIGELTVTPYRLDHPDPCWGFRVEADGKALAHCADTEATRTSREALGPDLPLYREADLMVFDAQYSIIEAAEKINWGHAAALIGLDLAIGEGIKKAAFIHHEPASSDEKIAAVEASTRAYYERQRRTAEAKGLPFHEVDWFFAREGMVVEL